MPGDAGYLADAMADELRDKLRDLAKQLAAQQAAVVQKEATIQQLLQQKKELEMKFNVPAKDRQTGGWYFGMLLAASTMSTCLNLIS